MKNYKNDKIKGCRLTNTSEMTLVTPPPPEILIHVVGGGIGGKRWILNEMAPYFTTKPISLLAFFYAKKKKSLKKLKRSHSISHWHRLPYLLLFYTLASNSACAVHECAKRGEPAESANVSAQKNPIPLFKTFLNLSCIPPHLFLCTLPLSILLTTLPNKL